MTLIKGRLINVSNRLPVVVKRYAGGPRVERSSGGLASALNSAWQHQPGIWIGWAGTSQNHVDHLLARASRRRSYTLQAVQLSNEEVAKFYSGFANEIIWPYFGLCWNSTLSASKPIVTAPISQAAHSV